MKLFILATSLCLLVITPAFARALPVQAHDCDEPRGTVDGALKTIDRYKRSKKLRNKFEYYSSWQAAEKELNEMAYAYEGMILDQRAYGDFMKDHKIIIIRDSYKFVKGYLYLVEEVIYPVWSRRNQAHVLRGVKVRRTFRSSQRTGAYRGVDGEVHRLK